jgi:2-(1,2-epoxy-1,2-dihydrophenyl)acetyl-CoA isomerase
MSFENLHLEINDGVATVTLDRPDAANAINLPLGIDLMHTAIRCDDDPRVRAVVIRGAGRFFCAGGDVASFAESEDSMPSLIKELTTHLHAAISRFARMRAPVITAVQGPAAGAGFSLACAGDLTIASESARFTMAYTRVGLAPDGSSTYWIPRLIGVRRALELMLTNRTLSAAEALEWGLVNRVVADDALEAEVNGLARTLASGPTEAFGLTKRLVLSSATESLESQMEQESRAISDAARTADAREGIAAFLARRDPRFSGA